MTQTIPIKLAKKHSFLIKEDFRYKVLYGGRGGAKSYAAALGVLWRAAEKKRKICCARMYQNSIDDSVYSLLVKLINDLGIRYLFDVQKTEIVAYNGSRISFKGIAVNIQNMKSMEDFDIIWIEEAVSVSEAAWDIIQPTFRKTGSEIWLTFNPEWVKDATYQRFVINPPPNCKSVLVNYYDNPWFNDTLRAEMEHDKATNRAKYEHIWLGKPYSEGANLIQLSKFQRYENAPDAFPYIFITADTAFSEKQSADGSAFLLVGVLNKKIYLLDGYWKRVTFPDLRRDMKSFYMSAKQRFPNLSTIWIENKASGQSLIQQLREDGLPVSELYPTVRNAALKAERTADKYTRFLEIQGEIDSERIYIPSSAAWLNEFTTQAEAFTGGKQDEHDDFIDAMIYAIKKACQGIEVNWEKALDEAF
jgi:PBSX family phage terminase large subunit